MYYLDILCAGDIWRCSDVHFCGPVWFVWGCLYVSIALASSRHFISDHLLVMGIFAPMIGSLARTDAEIGARLGIGFAVTGELKAQLRG